MSTFLISGGQAISILKEALGLPADRPIQRLVIEADAGGILKVYVTCFANKAQVLAVADALPGLMPEVEEVEGGAVDEFGRVITGG